MNQRNGSRPIKNKKLEENYTRKVYNIVNSKNNMRYRDIKKREGGQI